MAVNFILSQASPGAKALVIATDISRFIVTEGGDALTQDWSFAEPSGGAGAVAMLVSEQPHIFQLDVGANGYYGYEVMDTCRPHARQRSGRCRPVAAVVSRLLRERLPASTSKRVDDVRLSRDRSSYLAFHTPFGGMVKGAHRNMMRKIAKAQAAARSRRISSGACSPA